ncbi:hypothetical protein PHYPSEUDO_011069 [Phytophthora pseudosyringae]|uniref:Ubiquitin-like domain-containing protein n=1 Tax=Phytophthora pseudosyringae TaxID=221518 RepID=A0A8T1VE01_9STRA|nr:hypothetical protein PHYPSEUDO_011069 [Phytophthora pseudosyringae]
MASATTILLRCLDASTGRYYMVEAASGDAVGSLKSELMVAMGVSAETAVMLYKAQRGDGYCHGRKLEGEVQATMGDAENELDGMETVGEIFMNTAADQVHVLFELVYQRLTPRQAASFGINVCVVGVATLVVAQLTGNGYAPSDFNEALEVWHHLPHGMAIISLLDGRPPRKLAD